MEDKKIKKLSAEELENISGGYIYLNYKGEYEVMDWDGNVVEAHGGPDGLKKCVERCRELGLSDRVIEWEDLEEIIQIREGTY